MEIYFNNNSMRIASDNEWIKLSKWRKIEIKKDTLYFDTFGEWRTLSKAEIKFISINTIELKLLSNDRILKLIQIDENLNFEKPKEFWNKFHNRKKSKNCKST